MVTKKNKARQTKRKKAVKKQKIQKTDLILHALGLLAILALTLWTYSGIETHEFTNWDDNLYVTENPYLLNYEKDGSGPIFSTESNVAGNYHPLTVWSLAINYENNRKFNQATGKYDVEASAFLATNKWLHVLNSILVYLLVLLLAKGRIEIALFCAGVFALHPLHVESVAWVSARKDLLYALFFLASAISYVYYVRKKQWLYLILSLFLFVPSLLSKPAAVVLPLVLLLIDLLENRKIDLMALVEKVPFFIGSVVIGLITIGTQTESEAVAEFGAFTIWERIVFASYGFVTYIVKFFAPIKLSPFHPYPTNKEIDLIFNLYPLLALAIIALGIWLYKKQRAFSFGIGFYLISLILVLQFVSVGNAIIAERYTYVAYIGLSFALAWILSELLRKKLKEKFLIPALGIAFISMAAFAFAAKEQSKAWKDTPSLWTKVIESYPDKQSKAYNNRGIHFKDNQQFEEALQDYNKGISVDSTNYLLFNSRGNVYKALAEKDRNNRKTEYLKAAVADLSRAVTIKEDHHQSWNSLGLAYLDLKEYDKALRSFNKALAVNPDYHKVHVNLAGYYLQTGELEKALTEYEYYLNFYPTEVQILAGKAFTLFRLDRIDEAHQLSMKCLSADPNNRQYLYLTSLTLQAKGKYNQALNNAEKSKKLGHPVPQSHIRNLKNQVKNGGGA